MAAERVWSASEVRLLSNFRAGLSLRVQAFCEQALVSSRAQYDLLYKRSVEDPAGFWGDIAREFYWCARPSSCTAGAEACSGRSRGTRPVV